MKASATWSQHEFMINLGMEFGGPMSTSTVSAVSLRPIQMRITEAPPKFSRNGTTENPRYRGVSRMAVELPNFHGSSRKSHWPPIKPQIRHEHHVFIHGCTRFNHDTAQSFSTTNNHCGNSPLTRPGIAWQLMLLMPGGRLLISASSEKCSVAKSFGFVKSSVQSGFWFETQSLSTFRTRETGESTLVHVPRPSPTVTPSSTQVPVPLGPEQALGTKSARAAILSGALWTAMPERERMKVSAIDAEKNMLIKSRKRKRK
ncbi:hypothetical protein C8F04DRAFT_1098411 [Mycena alexandri]|uniref:Uncharacterized protein n=1 Tax=Mycena alexandri TaxID=1745969 RepID=A0AAD6X4P1_9AGAR|nr:hypothetical protein C8F04DRAFT_1098411 [Mycena alexandri]